MSFYPPTKTASQLESRFYRGFPDMLGHRRPVSKNITTQERHFRLTLTLGTYVYSSPPHDARYDGVLQWSRARSRPGLKPVIHLLNCIYMMVVGLKSYLILRRTLMLSSKTRITNKLGYCSSSQKLDLSFHFASSISFFYWKYKS
jgi:hypothetical protein